MSPRIAPYGFWESPITAEMVASAGTRFEQMALVGNALYWSEMRPMEAGRSVIVRHITAGTAQGKDDDIIPPPFSARTRVHEYGGGSFVASKEAIYFSNDSDQRLYVVRLDNHSVPSLPRPLTSPGPWRYADGIIDPARKRLICVREDHGHVGCEPINALVAISLEEGKDAAQQVLVSGNDFYAAPRLSPNGRRLAWLTWNHPNMPWDNSELWVGEIGPRGEIVETRRIVGGEDESVSQPLWSPNGLLYFVSDRSGWWNLYTWSPQSGQIRSLLAMEAEFSLPQWVFNISTYGFLCEERLIAAYTQDGMWKLGQLDTRIGQFDEVQIPFDDISEVRLDSARQRVFLNAASQVEAASLLQLDFNHGFIDVIRPSSPIAIDSSYFSKPEVIHFTSGNRQTVHAFYYPPCNPDYAAPAGEKPPLLVFSHGGPTSMATSSLNLSRQYWTSRGFAIVDVNYRGSAGFGRHYRQQLRGQWGVVDVEDCVSAACYLIEQGKVDGERLAIRGGSAGGYTTLCALVFYNIFKAGASYYGVSDLEALARDTHKFESHYLENLVGPYPQKQMLYRQRSPIHFVDRLSCPMIFFQGLDDRVVPPEQTERMVAALQRKGLPVTYLSFEGEGHGFRSAKNIQRCLEAEYAFYQQVFRKHT